MKVFSALICIVFAFSLFGCGNSQSHPADNGSKLPAQMPPDVVMSYNSFGGYRPINYEIRISDLSISVNKRGGAENEEKWTDAISSEEKSEIYATFVRSEFDLIENEKAKGYSHDTVSETVEINFGEFNKKVEYEEREKPLSKQDLLRFQNVANSIKALAEKHSSSKE